MVPEVVFVLGAGSSAHLGLPCGDALSDKIRVDPRYPKDDFRLQHPDGSWDAFSSDALQQQSKILSSKLEMSHCTIDTCLSDHPGLMQAGRYNIASHLLPACYHVLTGTTYRTNWIDSVLKGLNSNRNLLDDIRIVTFNYDDIFPIVLTGWHAGRTHSADDESYDWRIVKQRIARVHGGLFYPDHWRYLAERGRADKQRALLANEDSIRHAAHRLRVTGGSNSSTDADTALARGWIKEAAKIVFLGFGFDRRNLETIGCINLATEPGRVFATGFGVDAAHHINIRRLLGDKVLIGGRDQDCAAFLHQIRKHWLLS